jgi:hypothetical protein
MHNPTTVIRRIVEKPRELVEQSEQLQAWIERFERIDFDGPQDSRRGL